jgi:hypothetical protein
VSARKIVVYSGLDIGSKAVVCLIEGGYRNHSRGLRDRRGWEKRACHYIIYEITETGRQLLVVRTCLVLGVIM